MILDSCPLINQKLLNYRIIIEIKFKKKTELELFLSKKFVG